MLLFDRQADHMQRGVSEEGPMTTQLVLPVRLSKVLGHERAANIIALSAFAARSGIVGIDLLRETVKGEFDQKEVSFR